MKWVESLSICLIGLECRVLWGSDPRPDTQLYCQPPRDQVSANKCPTQLTVSSQSFSVIFVESFGSLGRGRALLGCYSGILAAGSARHRFPGCELCPAQSNVESMQRMFCTG